MTLGSVAPKRQSISFSRSANVDVSVVVYVNQHLENASQLYAYVANTLKELGKSFEFIFMDDGNDKDVFVEMEGFQSFAKNVRVIRLPRRYGASVAMPIGFRKARGQYILTLSSFLQVHTNEIKKMFEKINQGYDFVNGWRVNRKDTRMNRAHTKIYNALVRLASNVNLHDSNCTLKLFRRELIEEFRLYGDLYQFLPVLAAQNGFRVCEVQVEQRKELNSVGVYSIGTYLARFLDVVTLFFLSRFIMKPLRFFGTVGIGLFSVGFAISLYLVYVKYGLGMAIGGRPLLLLGALLIMVGLQVLSVGLVGELILFFQARQVKDHRIEKILG